MPKRSRLPDASVDAVLDGNALHWFDMAIAGPEIARVLASGASWLGCGTSWATGSTGLRDSRGSVEARPSARVTLSAPGAPRPTFPARPSRPSSRTDSDARPTRWSRPRDARGMLVMPESEREATLNRIRGFLASRPETATGEFTLPMLTGVLRIVAARQ
ncbi:hypothetical protein [Kibdelosporangium philippinense]|uniref:hypothetical protein n=1 Tax=Kibdelosporangium philippinense TaxID=211113 RepID=UPI00360792B9